MDTANPNCWNTAAATIATASDADLLLIQETKVAVDKGNPRYLKRAAEKLGWNAVDSSARRNPTGYPSGGCMVMATSGIGIQEQPQLVGNGFHQTFLITSSSLHYQRSVIFWL